MASTPTSALNELVALADLIKTSVDEIVKVAQTSSLPFPSPHEPFSLESEALRMSPDVQKHSSIMVSAAAQLISTVRPPPLTLLIHGFQFHITACLGIAVDHHVAEILRAAGPKGAHVKEIAAYTKADPQKLARVLRLLATSLVFKEVSPDTFAHTRVSSLLDTGKDIESILADPEAKHDGTLGVAALIEHFSDEAFKSSSYLPEALRDPKFARSHKPEETAFNLAFKADRGLFGYFDMPENSHRVKRFAMAMQGAQNIAPPTALLKGFDWKALPRGSVVVDVGGGIGSQSLVLAKAYDHLQIIIQDRPAVVEDAPKFWASELPEALKSGRVKFQAHDFFTPQTVQAPAVFFMRMILHDWADEYCVNILRQLRLAASPDTQLVVVDNIISYACEDPATVKDIPGASLPVPPAPLLPNYGEAQIVSYLADIQMLALLNGSERTVAQFKELYEASGWRLTRVETGDGFGTLDVKIIGVPA